MTTESTEPLRAALASLGRRRHSFQVAAAEHRDELVDASDYRMAAVWQELAVLVAEIEDDERATLAGLEFGPAVNGVLEFLGNDDSSTESE